MEFVQRFATTPHRVRLLLSFFEYRRQLELLGIVGVQCVNGSFCEDIEMSAGRAPGDIDVVTYFDRPAAHQAQADWDALVAAHPSIFDLADVKAKYSCDAYYVDTFFGAEWLVSQTAYWTNLFTHKKVTYDWKGMLALPLPSPGDAIATAHLVTLRVNP